MNKTMKDIKPILDEAKERLQKIYGEQLEGIILYGFGTKFTYTPCASVAPHRPWPRDTALFGYCAPRA